MWIKIWAFLLSFLSFFAFWNPNAQPNRIPETRSYTAEVEDKYGIWPTEEFTVGTASPLSSVAFEALYTVKGLIDGGLITESLLVLHKGKLIYENYEKIWDDKIPHAMHSVTKSVAATLVGIAIHEGKIGSIQDKVIDYFPDAVIAAGQERKRDMTIEHLLTMTSGIVCTTDEDWGTYYADDMEDSALWAFELPQSYDPGTQYVYDNVAPTIMLGIVARATGCDVLDYAQEKLFGPLGMTSVRWETTADGMPCGGFGIWMVPRDMLRFGYLYLNYGRWEDAQIFSPEWAAQAAPRSTTPNAYGHTFWNNEVLPFFGFYEADGAYGQFISVYPSLDLVVVRTGREGTVRELFARNWGSAYSPIPSSSLS